MDSVPVVAFTGQVKTSLIGNDAFQEVDIIGITRPISKHNYLVKDINKLATVIKNAFHIALTGRPGVVVVDIPVDVQMQEADFHYPEQPDIRGYKPTYKGHIGQIKRACKLISSSRRPVFYVGGGVIIAGASDELIELVKKTEIPVTMTLMGLGAFPGTHKLSLGMLGMHGTAYANHAVQESDLIIAIGARFDDRVTGKIEEFAPGAKIIHIDIDPCAISKNVAVDVPVVGDAKSVLGDLLKNVKKPEISEWHKQIDIWKKKYPLMYKNDSKLRPQYVVEEIYNITKGEAIITTEVGQNQMWASQFYKYDRPRQFISSGGLGTMGYGFPAAIGVQMGCPKKVVFDIAGDGSIQMNIQELTTAVANKLPVKVAILNNGYLGMVRQWQELFYKKRYSYTKLECCPDFVKLAEAYGAVGMRITKKEDVRKAIKDALKINKPVLMDFRVEPEENVFPMVPAGQAINKMIGALA